MAVSCRRQYFPEQNVVNKRHIQCWFTRAGGKRIMGIMKCQDPTSLSLQVAAVSTVWPLRDELSPGWNKVQSFSMFALCQLCFIPNWIISFNEAFLRLLSRNDNHKCITKWIDNNLNLRLKTELVLWLKSTRKTAADNEGLWWLKLVPGSTCVGCGGKIVSLLSSASDNIMPGPGLYRLNCQSLATVITINLVLEQRKNLCLEVFFLAKLRECVSVVTILMVRRIPVKNSEWI